MIYSIIIKTAVLGSSTIVLHCLIVKNDLTWQLFVKQNPVDHSMCSELSSFPQQLNPELLASMLSCLASFQLFSGHPGTCFVQFLREKKGKKGGSVRLFSKWQHIF